MMPKVDLLHRVGDLFQTNEQPLAAAIVYAEVAREFSSDAGVWFGLAIGLSRCAGRLERKPFFEWSARCLKRALLEGPSPEMEDRCHEWLMDYSSEVGVDDLRPMTCGHLPQLLAFLDIDLNIVPNAISALAEDDCEFVILALAEQGNLRFLPALLSALRGVWGEMNVRLVLKRLGMYGDSPEIRETLEIVAFSAKAHLFEPYLVAAMNGIDPKWANEVLRNAAEARKGNPDRGFSQSGSGVKPWWKFWNR